MSSQLGGVAGQQRLIRSDLLIDGEYLFARYRIGAGAAQRGISHVHQLALECCVANRDLIGATGHRLFAQCHRIFVRRLRVSTQCKRELARRTGGATDRDRIGANGIGVVAHGNGRHAAGLGDIAHGHGQVPRRGGLVRVVDISGSGHCVTSGACFGEGAVRGSLRNVCGSLGVGGGTSNRGHFRVRRIELLAAHRLGAAGAERCVSHACHLAAGIGLVAYIQHGTGVFATQAYVAGH